MSRSAVRHRLAKGVLQRIATNLYCIGGVPIDSNLRLRAAVLECGGRSAIGKWSAAAHWDFPGFRTEPIHVLRQRDGTFPPVRFATLHTTTVLTSTQIVDVEGLLVTTPARTLFDLAGSIHRSRLERLLDRAWSRRLVNWHLMRRAFIELQERGRPGIVVMRELLDARPPDYVAPESNLETRFRKLLLDDGQPEMDRQVDLGDAARWLGRVDFLDRDRKVIAEIQSDLHHLSISDQRDDALRRTRLTDGGWVVVEIREFELWHQPDRMKGRLREARGRSRHTNLQPERSP